MKICVAQIRSTKGDVAANIESHKKLIDLASNNDAIFFSELSITGYEPELAKVLAFNSCDKRLDVFQELSDQNNLTIGIGAPTRSDKGIQISMIIFQPNKPRQTYSKQQLHSDELPYFVEGQEQLILAIANHKLAPAICYESLQLDHSEKAFQLGANIYIASVAKSQSGVDKAMRHFPEVAKKYGMPVLMANCVGYCDNFQSAGKTAVWAKDGEIKAQLNNDSEGLLIFDTETEAVHKILVQL